MEGVVEKNKIDGFDYAQKINQKLSALIQKVRDVYNITPNIAVIMVGDNPASEIYVKNKIKLSEKLGIKANLMRYSPNIQEKELISQIQLLNQNKEINGIMVQLPLPEHINKDAVLLSISPEKDIDGLHPFNAGLLHCSKNVPYNIDEVLTDKLLDLNFRQKIKQLGKTIPFIPCTPLGCLHLIRHTLEKEHETITGKNAVIFGNSNLVSKPLVRLLLQEGASVTTLHSKSQNYENIISTADIIVSATGHFQKLQHIKNTAILIDVGIRQQPDSNKITGDLDFNNIVKTNKITPVPKGVGPMTIASLMLNSYLSAIKNLE